MMNRYLAIKSKEFMFATTPIYYSYDSLKVKQYAQFINEYLYKNTEQIFYKGY